MPYYRVYGMRGQSYGDAHLLAYDDDYASKKRVINRFHLSFCNGGHSTYGPYMYQVIGVENYQFFVLFLILCFSGKAWGSIYHKMGIRIDGFSCRFALC